MHEEFAEAWVNQSHTVYGLRLKPLCLLHLFYLALAENAAYYSDEAGEVDLRAAALICSAEFEDLEKGDFKLTPWRHFWWKLRTRKVDAASQFERFKVYKKDYDSRPQMSLAGAGEGGGKPMNAPSILQVATFLEMNSNMTEREIMTAPIGKVFWKAAAITEVLGHGSIADEGEIEFLKLKKKLAEEEKLKAQENGG